MEFPINSLKALDMRKNTELRNNNTSLLFAEQIEVSIKN